MGQICLDKKITLAARIPPAGEPMESRMRMASAELDWEVESSPAQSRQSTDAPAPPTDP